MARKLLGGLVPPQEKTLEDMVTPHPEALTPVPNGRSRRFRMRDIPALLRSWSAQRPAGKVRYMRPNPDVDRMFRAFRNVSVMRPPD